MRKLNLQFFAQVIDLTDQLSNAKSSIKIGGKEYEINEGFKTMLEADKVLKNQNKMSQIDMITKMFEILFGQREANELIEANYPIKFYRRILETALEVIKGDNNEGK